MVASKQYAFTNLTEDDYATLTWTSTDLDDSTSPGYYYLRCSFSGGVGAGAGQLYSIRYTENYP